MHTNSELQETLLREKKDVLTIKKTTTTNKVGGIIKVVIPSQNARFKVTKKLRE